MKYLFLDIDGVLHAVSARPEQRWSAAHRLEELLSRHRDVRVVITSTYRWFLDLDGFRSRLSTSLRERLVSATPCALPGTGEESLPERHREVLAWLEGNAQASAQWLAIDDNKDHYAQGCRRLYLVDGGIGLTDADVDAISIRLHKSDLCAVRSD